MQVMGQVAREHGFAPAEHPFLSELCDPEQGIDVGCRVLSAKLALAANDLPRNAPRPAAQPSGGVTPSTPELLTRALLLWNGGGNPSYPAQVLARLPRYA
jgi:hypothetical protein